MLFNRYNHRRAILEKFLAKGERDKYTHGQRRCKA